MMQQVYDLLKRCALDFEIAKIKVRQRGKLIERSAHRVRDTGGNPDWLIRIEDLRQPQDVVSVLENVLLINAHPRLFPRH